ncbi:hypothetical protein A167_00818 [Alcanivorax sp. S71-1-4]|nr:hypothetical protein A167_00818 [Alcanivorax sp. S71-1-4]
MAYATERTAMVGCAKSLCSILNHGQVMSLGERHDRVHVAGDSSVMDGHNSTGSRRDRLLCGVWTQIESVWLYIDEYRNGAA